MSVDISPRTRQWAGSSRTWRVLTVVANPPESSVPADLVRRIVTETNAQHPMLSERTPSLPPVLLPNPDELGGHVFQGVAGVHLRLRAVGKNSERRQWVDAFVASLNEAGAEGRLERLPAAYPPAAFLKQQQERGVNGLLAWTDGDHVAEKVRATLATFTPSSAKAHVFIDETCLLLANDALPALLTHMLEDPAEAGIAIALADGPDGSDLRIGRRYSSFCEQDRRCDRLADAARAADFLTTQADMVDYACVRTGRRRLTWFELSSDEPRPPGGSPASLRGEPARNYVPDAYGIQVLTAGHLGRAHDLSSWNVDDLGHDRFLVTAADLRPWIVPDVPPDDVLARARADFGDMIASEDYLSELRRLRRLNA